jgi:predicted TIM-barrel enzyme
MLKDSFGADKPIIGMIHLGALPGSCCTAAGGMAR